MLSFRVVFEFVQSIYQLVAVEVRGDKRGEKLGKRLVVWPGVRSQIAHGQVSSHIR
jgi:hypothetical protein